MKNQLVPFVYFVPQAFVPLTRRPSWLLDFNQLHIDSHIATLNYWTIDEINNRMIKDGIKPMQNINQQTVKYIHHLIAERYAFCNNVWFRVHCVIHNIKGIKKWQSIAMNYRRVGDSGEFYNSYVTLTVNENKLIGKALLFSAAMVLLDIPSSMYNLPFCQFNHYREVEINGLPEMICAILMSYLLFYDVLGIAATTQVALSVDITENGELGVVYINDEYVVYWGASMSLIDKLFELQNKVKSVVD